MALIEKRIERNVRREIAASRLDPSQVIYSTLGPFPADDPDKAVAWDDGAHAIATYRHRYDVHDDADRSANSLAGHRPEPSGPELSGGLRTRQQLLGRVPDRSSEQVVGR